MPRKKKTIDFEQSLQKLESLVNQMEQGDLSLEESLQAFEKGVGLTRECQNILAEAEQKVQILVESGGELKTEPFTPEEE
ncbi:exodeoxyribonuclease VII small subunit [Neptuniibacter caesariensis]|uniref:Exodeoxyribonuclease 7 small subunit n=1 Tax=Neptuniibacter caesariensis TaxID=207954 RepID=A0A7U8GSS6_NEPCE|nr:exodeoxyribonuclease VII small subunit [Neptuniibacter caesariensis]EAR61390.1 exodeoxyribonuclease VII small subunit [Oceanospirillum sp. MED92] [Neptuniibacter caesariensis]